MRGGVSTGISAGLNGGWDLDTKEHVEQNRTIALHTLGIYTPGLVCIQKHTTIARSIPRDLPLMGAAADALVTQSPDIALGVITADCAPVLFYDPLGGIIAAAHAGWRGAVNGILENTVHEMRALGATTATIQATIGPTIARSSYRVSPDFLDTVQASTLFSIKPMTTYVDDAWFFDLPMYISKRLEPLVSHIHNLGCDTFGQTFFSRRYALNKHQNQTSSQTSGTESCAAAEPWDCGRNMSWISLS
jgi:YfiH family protein